jgi:UDP-N-acetylmuramyl pentapeptide phosphotransferase/UDP-N-acetylglucosamine-1-phosphate transferase
LGRAPPGTVPIVLAAAALAAVSWQDDRRGLPVAARLGAHVLAVLAGLAALSLGPVFQGLLPPLLDRLATALLWVWFVNLYNFMDGIDGIAGVETVTLGAGAALASWLAPALGGEVAPLALCAAAAGLGFLRWNWPPAQIFLGDVGSVPLGYALGFVLLLLAGRGLWAPALILPLYYLADATITLARRVRRGERFWRAHKEHFYQRALRGADDHAAVARMILAGNLVLTALAAVAVARPVLGLALAAVAVATLLLLLQRRAGHGG